MTRVCPQAQESCVLATDERDARGRRVGASPATVDWANWMRGLGQSKRRVRELLGLSQEQLARLAERGSLAQAVEEAVPQAALQLLDLLAECRLRDVALFGRSAEAAGLRHGDEVAELMDFHKQNLSN